MPWRQLTKVTGGLLPPAIAALAIAAVACDARTPDPAERRALAERVAQDTAARAWRHAVGVDSVRTRADTLIVWVSPRGWMATDAPQAGVQVAPDGRVTAVQWVMGG